MKMKTSYINFKLFRPINYIETRLIANSLPYSAPLSKPSTPERIFGGVGVG